MSLSFFLEITFVCTSQAFCFVFLILNRPWPVRVRNFPSQGSKLSLSPSLSLSQPAVLNWKAASDQLVEEGEGEVGRGGLGGEGGGEGLGFPLSRRRCWQYRSLLPPSLPPSRLPRRTSCVPCAALVVRPSWSGEGE